MTKVWLFDGSGHEWYFDRMVLFTSLPSTLVDNMNLSMLKELCRRSQKQIIPKYFFIYFLWLKAVLMWFSRFASMCVCYCTSNIKCWKIFWVVKVCIAYIIIFVKHFSCIVHLMVCQINRKIRTWKFHLSKLLTNDKYMQKMIVRWLFFWSFTESEMPLYIILMFCCNYFCQSPSMIQNIFHKKLTIILVLLIGCRLLMDSLITSIVPW